MRILQVHERGRLQGRICCKFLVQPEPRVRMDVELTHSILSPSLSTSLSRSIDRLGRLASTLAGTKKEGTLLRIAWIR